MASSASQPVTASGGFDIHKPAEYPIVLGSSLKDTPSNREQLIDVRYNWRPKSEFRTLHSKLTSSDGSYNLAVTVDGESDTHYSYRGHKRPQEADLESLVLVYDEKKSCFVLERVSSAVDFNLASASSQTKDEVQRHPRLPTKGKKSENGIRGNNDDTPDPTNPFDFRNFLDEAKESAEKGGSSTPLPGSRTPMSGFASPVHGPSRFTATTPQARPSTPVVKKIRREEPTKKPRTDSPRKPKPDSKSRQPLSKERVSDSDDELSDTITVKRPTTSQPKGHSRHDSAGADRSPHIVVNDGELEIDMGSPPPENRGRKRGRLDPAAFRSHTGTPAIGRSPAREPPKDDVRMKSDSDEDVEELELGSPRTSRQSMGGSKSASTVEPASERIEHAPTPSNQAVDDDDDDLLAQELEAALEEDDSKPEKQGHGYGLGISGTGPGAQEDESEVSEEE